MPPCISPGVQALSRDTSISLTGNVHLNVGPFWAALRRPYCSAPQGELAPSSPRCAGIDLTFSCVIGLWTHYNPPPGVCQDFFAAIKNQRPPGRKREKPVTWQQFFSENRKGHRQTAQYLESVRKRREIFYKPTPDCNMCYILFWQEGDRGAKMTKKRRKTCEIVAKFSLEGNFPVAFSWRERGRRGQLVYFYD